MSILESFEPGKVLCSNPSLLEPWQSTTRLHVHVMHQDFEKFEQELGNFPTIDVVDQNGNTPLHLASLHGFVDLVKFLLERKANIHSTNKSLMTPLHKAAIGGHLQVVELLVKGHANVLARNLRGHTPVDCACRCKHSAITQYLTKQENEAIRHIKIDKSGNTALHYVAAAGRYNATKSLLDEATYDVNAKNRLGNTPLHHAVYEDHYHIVDLLLERGAEIFALNYENHTPFDIARRRGNIRLMNSLVRYEKQELSQLLSSPLRQSAKARVQFPLHFACRLNRLDLVRHCLTQSYDLKALDESGDTPLQVALKYAEPGVCRLLEHLSE